jgi:hypothetical protein
VGGGGGRPPPLHQDGFKRVVLTPSPPATFLSGIRHAEGFVPQETDAHPFTTGNRITMRVPRGVRFSARIVPP